MFQTEHLQEKWQPVLEHNDLPEINDSYRKAVTTVILENQEKALREDSAFLSEAAPTNSTGSAVDNWDPILISLVRRAMPNLIAYDVAGVQPMTGPTGLIFAMRSRYTNQSGTETFYNEADSDFSGAGTQAGTNPAILNDSPAGTYTGGTGMATADAEAKGDSGSNHFAEMAFSIEKQTVTAKSRALKADTATAGIFDMDVVSNGRWSVEKFKGLMFQLERDANVIAQQTRRGKGNVIICSSDVASALQMAGVLDYTPALNNNLNVDDAGNTFAGVLNGRFKVYIDPYSANADAKQYYTVGYKGTSPYDSGIFYCPYVPLQMVRAVGENTFQPKIGFKTRYGMASNPFVGSTPSNGLATSKTNQYYRIFRVDNILKLVSRLDMVLLQTHLLVEQLFVKAHLLPTTTYTTEEYKLLTSCSNKNSVNESEKGELRFPLFFWSL